MLRKFINQLLRPLAYLWRTHDALPASTDLIVVVSFGASSDLSDRSKAVVKKALQMRERYPDARIAFGTFAHDPDPQIESGVKMMIFPDAIYYGEVANSIEEAQAARRSMTDTTVGSVLVVTDAWHSRSARYVWRRVWDGADIRIATGEYVGTDPLNPMVFQRDEILWGPANIIRHCVLLIPGGFEWMERSGIRQPT